jgi:DNA-binding MarR family transcriptional regulator
MTQAFTDSLAMRLRRAYLTLHRYAQGQFDELGITADQYVIMRLIHDQPGLNQRQVVELSASDASTVGAMVRLLESRAVLRRLPDPADRRARRLELTAEGEKLLKKAEIKDRAVHALIAAATKGRSTEALSEALDALAQAVPTRSADHADRLPR